MMRLLCLGDSNTYGYDPRSYFGSRYGAENRWVELLAAHSGWEVINAGENGREIPRRQGELRQVERLLTSSQPLDLLLVMLGTNDLLQGADAAGAAARMVGFLTRIDFVRQGIVLIGPPPMKPGTWVTEERLLDDSVKLSGAYQDLAQGLGIRYVDAGRWDIELAFDGVHFSEEGHNSFAEKIYHALEEMARTQGE